MSYAESLMTRGFNPNEDTGVEFSHALMTRGYAEFPIFIDALQSDDIQFFITGAIVDGGGQFDPNSSLGGYRSVQGVQHSLLENVFDNIREDQRTAGVTEYRCISVKNIHSREDLENVRVWFSFNTEREKDKVYFAIEIPYGSYADGYAQLISDESQEPVDDSIGSLSDWSQVSSYANGVDINIAGYGENINYGEILYIWFKRVIESGADISLRDSVTITVGNSILDSSVQIAWQVGVRVRQFSSDVVSVSQEDANFFGVLIAQARWLMSREIKLISQYRSEQIRGLQKSMTPSGWVTPIDIISSSSSGVGRIYVDGITENIINLSENNVYEEVVVNGQYLKVGRVNQEQNTITLDSPPISSYRTDLVFLEVWFKQIEKPINEIPLYYRQAGLMDDGTYFPYGNTQHFVDSNFPGIPYDKEEENSNVETARRLQIQYRIRVVGSGSEGVDPDIYPEGLDDPLVKAWPSNKRSEADGVAETSYGYTKTEQDDGLFIAGDGSSDSAGSLGTHDGYMYTIPICMIHRRNSSAYHVTNNVNGAGSIISVQSDRPDELYSTLIVPEDIIDLRHNVSSMGFDNSLIEKSLDLLLKGNLKTRFGGGDGVGVPQEIHGTELMYVEKFGGSDETYINRRILGNNTNILSMSPNGQRRNWFDGSYSEKCHAKVSQSTKILPPNTDYSAIRFIGAGNWSAGDVIKITFPLWASSNQIEGVVIRYEDSSDPSPVTSDFTIEYYEDRVICTLNNTPSWTAAQTLHIDYTIDYPNGGGLIHVPKEILKIEDKAGILIYGNGLRDKNSYLGYDGIWKFDVINNINNNKAGILYRENPTIEATSNNQISIDLPSGFTAVGIERLINQDTVTDLESVITDWRQTGDVVTINVSSGISIGEDITAYVFMDKDFLLLDANTKTVVEVCETKEISIQINSNAGIYYLSNGEYSEFNTLMTGSVPNVRVENANGGTGIINDIVSCTIQVLGNRVKITGLTPGLINNGGTVKATLTQGKNLKNDQSLTIWYKYIPYIGLLQDQTIPSLNRWWKLRNKGGMTVQGTGGYDRTVERLIKVIRPVVPMLPGKLEYDYLADNEIPVDNLMVYGNSLGDYKEGHLFKNAKIRTGQLENEDVKFGFKLFKINNLGVEVDRGHLLDKGFVVKGGKSEIELNGIILGLSLSDRLNNLVTWEDNKKIRAFIVAISQDETPQLLVIVGSECINIGISGSYDFAIADVFNLLGRPLVKKENVLV